MRARSAPFSCAAGGLDTSTLAIYLKAMLYLGHARFMPEKVPRQLRVRLAEDLALPDELTRIRRIDPGEKSRIVSQARDFIGFRPFDHLIRTELESWLQDGIAREEGDHLAVINSLIRHIRHLGVELPPFKALSLICQRALIAADRRLQEEIGGLINGKDGELLDGLLAERNGRILFDRFKDDDNSLTARHHFRYGGGKNILLYQHVMSNCICFFTQALLCNVSEAIHMLHGILMQQSNAEPMINICDNAGKSDLVFGLAHLLNMEIWPRIRGHQNLRLWKASDEDSYRNIDRAIVGSIQWNLIDEGWQDMMWILASITSGTANPAMIATLLSTQPGHPAVKGFVELGKLVRTNYLLRYGMEKSLRNIVMRYTARRETWNQFGRSVFTGFGGLVKEKSQEGQEELFWFLTVIQNAIVF